MCQVQVENDYSYIILTKKDYSVLLFRLDKNLASNVSARCSGRRFPDAAKASSRNVGSLSSYKV